MCPKNVLGNKKGKILSGFLKFINSEKNEYYPNI